MERVTVAFTLGGASGGMAGVVAVLMGGGGSKVGRQVFLAAT